MKDPVDHIGRPPLPWRDSALTECGRPINDVAKVVSRDEAVARWKDQGAARAAYTLCMTCVQTADRHRSTWETSPIARFMRECEELQWVTRLGRRNAGPDTPDPREQRADLVTRELRAIAMLIEAHRDEFDAAVAGQVETLSLDKAREAKTATNHRN